jgi:hypothetical protein
VITEEDATAFCNVNLIGLHSVHRTEESSSLVMSQVWNIGWRTVWSFFRSDSTR